MAEAKAACQHDPRYQYEFLRGGHYKAGEELNIERGCLLCVGKTVEQADEFIAAMEKARQRSMASWQKPENENPAATT